MKTAEVQSAPEGNRLRAVRAITASQPYKTGARLTGERASLRRSTTDTAPGGYFPVRSSLQRMRQQTATESAGPHRHNPGPEEAGTSPATGSVITLFRPDNLHAHPDAPTDGIVGQSGVVPSGPHVPKLQPGESGVGQPPGEITARAEEENGPRRNRKLARAMADRYIEERRRDHQAVYGTDPAPTDILEQGVQTGTALFALETLDFFEEPVDLEDIANVAITDDDVRLDNNHAGMNDAQIWEASELLSTKVEASLRNSWDYRRRGPKLQDYRNLRLRAEEVAAAHKSEHEEVTQEDLIAVFTDDTKYQDAFRRNFGTAKAYVKEQKERIINAEREYSGAIADILERAEGDVSDLIENAESHQPTKEDELIQRAKISARVNRMWGDQAIDGLPDDLKSWLLGIPQQ